MQGPVVTDNGNFLVDWKFDTTKNWNWPSVHIQLKLIPGSIVLSSTITDVYYYQCRYFTALNLFIAVM